MFTRYGLRQPEGQGQQAVGHHSCHNYHQTSQYLLGMDSDSLKGKASELWDTIVRLETEKYDLEERQRRQDYDVSATLQIFGTTFPLQYQYNP